MKIEDFKVSLLKISEHEIVPLENGKTVRAEFAFLAGLIELDLFEKMKTRVNPLACLFVSPSVFVV